MQHGATALVPLKFMCKNRLKKPSQPLQIGTKYRALVCPLSVEHNQIPSLVEGNSKKLTSGFRLHVSCLINKS